MLIVNISHEKGEQIPLKTYEIQSFLKVLTYHKSPYGFVNNKDAVDSGVLKVFVTDKNGKRIELRDKDDPVDMTLDMTKV